MNKNIKHILIGVAIVVAVAVTVKYVYPIISKQAKGIKAKIFQYPVDVKELSASDSAKTVIKEHEGLRTKAYKVGSDRWTIGYGHTKGVYSGQSISEKQAREYLDEDIKEAEASIKRNVKTPLWQNEYDALVSLIYNIGIGNFAKSEVLAHLNKGDKQTASEKFMKHVYSQGKKLDGLVKRRKVERELFNQNLGKEKI